jgi:hypothetical protein
MAEVEVTRFVDADPALVERVLDPATVLEAEGTFDVVGVEETAEGWTVTGKRRGLGVPFEFREIEDGYRYEALGEHGPFHEFEGRLTYTPERHGTRLTASSTLRLNFPIQAVTDRVAGWKRRKELSRSLRTLADEVE